MKKSISVNKKSRGRPKKKGGVYPVTAVRLPPETLRGVDSWAKVQDGEPSRSEAIRRLVEMALANSNKRPARYPSKTAAKARELASKAIDGLIDSSAHADEKAIRKRRLLKGPSVFRDVRIDQEK
jgi:Arc/MetJ-type ribon-helix-helix transcriptional regulator